MYKDKEKIIHIRGELKKKFNKIAAKEGVSILEEYFQAPLPEDTILLNWISEDLLRIMRIQEVEEEYREDPMASKFSAFLGKTGVDYEIDDLCIIALDCHEKIGDIFEIYKMWFIDDYPPKKMQVVLDDYMKKYE